MTREEIEQIIKTNIRTNGRGEITARVMAGVLTSFVTYTDTLSADFAALVNAIADAFTVTVEELEEKFQTEAAALEAKFEGRADSLESAFEAFCRDLLENHFEPWADNLATALLEKMDLTMAAADAAKAAASTAAEKSTAAKTAIDEAADGVAEALDIIRRGNQDPVIVVPNGLKFGFSELTEYPADKFDFSQVTNWDGMFADNQGLLKAPAVVVEAEMVNGLFYDCPVLADVSEIRIKTTSSGSSLMQNLYSLEEVPAGVLDLSGSIQSLFYNCASLKKAHVKIRPYPGLTPFIVGELLQCFYDCPSLEEVTFDLSEFEAGQKINLQSSFYFTAGSVVGIELPANLLERCLNITDSLGIVKTIPDFDGTINKSLSQNWGDSILENVGHISNWDPVNVNFSRCTRLTLQSLQNIVDSLPSGTNRTMTVSSASLQIMQSAGLVAAANAKGWTVTA